MIPVKLFISYAHDDRKRWLEPVRRHLLSVQNVGAVHVYDDSKLRPGQEWDPELKRQLDEADIVVLVVTPAFLASAYCTSVEVTRAMDRHKDGAARIVPILADHANWKCMPFRILEIVPKNENEKLVPLVDWRNINRPLAIIAEKVEAIAREIGARKAAAAKPVGSLGRLPEPVWNFTGRSDELETLRRQLENGGRSAITPHAITGLGGIGKTQLALAYAHKHRGEYGLVHWIAAEEPAGLAAGYVALAPALGLAPGSSDQADLITAIREQLESRERFLLVFDNAPGPAALRPYLPRGKGHVLITSRERLWRGTAQPLELDLLAEADAIELLADGSADTAVRAEAKALAKELGFLPLALAQARAYMDELAVDIPTYRRRLAHSARSVLGRGLPEGADYTGSVATVWQASIEAAEQRCPAARPLLELLAFLAPDAVPRNLFDADPELLSEGLREPAERDEAVGALARFSLLRAEPTTLTVHRLVQAVTRDGPDEASAGARVEATVQLLKAAWPGPPWEHTLWPRIADLLPHVLASTSHAERLGVALPTTATLLNNSGLYLKARAAWTQAEPLYQRAIAIGEKSLGPQHPSLATWLNNLANLYAATGRYAEAEPLYERAMSITERTLGPEHPSLAIRLNNLAGLYQATGRYAEALPLFQRAIAIDEKALGPEHPDVATDLNNLAELYRVTGRYAEAEPLFLRAITILERTLPPNHPNLRVGRHNYARLLDEFGRADEAAVLRASAEAAGD
jgi:tetratricopeptide (TPR) repeat protein